MFGRNNRSFQANSRSNDVRKVFDLSIDTTVLSLIFIANTIYKIPSIIIGNYRADHNTSDREMRNTHDSRRRSTAYPSYSARTSQYLDGGLVHPFL